MLWAVGVFGLLLFGLGLLTDYFFGGLDVDGRQPPSEMKGTDWLYDLAIGFILVYYVVAAKLNWSARLWKVGVTMHSVASGLFAIGFCGNNHPIGSPMILPGLTIWLVYARQNEAIRPQMTLVSFLQ